MPVKIDFHLPRSSQGNLTVALSPPTSIDGWSIQFQMVKRQGSTSGIITKSMASGFNGVSGMEVANTGQGIFTVSFNPAEVSGLDPGNYAYTVQRLGSGFQTCLAEGFRIMDYP